jgi:5-methyltetrahydrofolate--homocysteine methyltransferase
LNNTNDSHPIISRIRNGETIISDGATGTFLQQNGLEPGGCPEEFNVSKPDIIKKMARQYFNAGSDMVLTNSFGASVYRQKHYGFESQVEKFNFLSAQHARSQATLNNHVCGSIGPTGGFLEPLGDITSEEMYNSFKTQALSLQKGGADSIVIETMTAIEEAILAINAVKDNTKLLVMATMTFDKGPRGYFTMMGIKPDQAAKELTNAGADVVGSNCGNGIINMIEIANIMRHSTDTPLLVHSNAGIPTMKSGEIIYPEPPEYMAEKFMELRSIGVNIIGGCCGTGPKHIAELYKLLNAER